MSLLEEIPFIQPFTDGSISLPLTVDNHIYRRNGEAHRVKGISAFKLLNKFESGEDISPFLDCFPKANRVRIFLYVPWTGTGWVYPSNSAALDFLQFLGDRGIDAEFTLGTDDDYSAVNKARILLNFLQGKVNNLVLEAVNEPLIGDKLNPRLFEGMMEDSGFLYSSGVYEDTTKFFGNRLTFHSPRDGEWMRKFHDALEYWSGGGPSFKEEPACKVVSEGDEPIKPSELSNPEKTLDFYTYGAGCALFTGGATFHCESGKLCTIPTQDELQCAEYFFKGLEMFPEDAPNDFCYNRPEDHSLRTYTMGNNAIRVRPNGPFVMEEVSTPLDEFNICYTLK